VKIAKTILLVIGILALLMGGLWMGQGSGYIPWPESSFMISQTPWIWRGALLAVAGLVAIFIARRR